MEPERLPRRVPETLARLLVLGVLAAGVAACGGGGADSKDQVQAEVEVPQRLHLAPPEKLSAPFTVVSLTRLSETRVGRTTFDYVFEVSVRNDGAARRAVIADLTAVGAGSQIIDGRSIVGDIAAGQTAVSPDTITLRHDRALPFDRSGLVWSFAHAPDPDRIVPGVLLTDRPAQPALVGERYEQLLPLALVDSRNRIVGLSIATGTPGGSAPQIDLAGNVTWTPNAADFNATDRLVLTATLEVGPAQQFEVPVRVLDRRTVHVAAIPAAGGTIADPQGRYLVDLQWDDPASAVPGEVRIEEQFDASGDFSYAVVMPDVEGLRANVILAPNLTPLLDTAAPASSTPRKSAGRTGANLASLLPVDVPAAPGMLPDVGAQLAALSGDFGQSAYAGAVAVVTTRDDRFSYRIRSPSFLIREYDSQPLRGVYQIDANCVDSASCSAIRSNASPQVRRHPVILVHGYNLGGSLGGGEGTWGRLAEALKMRGHPVFELRWRSTMRFEEAAGVLALLGRAAQRMTGAQPIIVAHSFGGVVAHLAASGRGIRYTGSGWTTVAADYVFARVITLGSPLSGIAASPSESLGLTVGRDAESIIARANNFCGQVTCFQAGESFANPISRASMFAKVTALDAQRTGLQGDSEGEAVRTLHQAWRTGAAHQVPTTTVVALRKRPGYDFGSGVLADEEAYRLGDGLISFMGQAILPEDFAVNPYAEPGSLDILGIQEFGDSWFDRLSGLYALHLSANAHGGQPEVRVFRGGREYVFAMSVAHTSLYSGSLFGEYEYYPEVNYSAAVIRTSTQGAGVHPLFNLMLLDNYLGAQVVSPTPPPPIETVSVVRGRLVQDGSPVTKIAAVTIVNRVTGERLGRWAPALGDASDGSWAFDAGRLFTVTFPQGGVVLADWDLQLNIGDGVRAARHRVTRPLAADVDVGTIDLTLVPASSHVSVSGHVRSAAASAAVQGATIYLLKGDSWPASVLRRVQSTAVSRVLLSGPSGEFLAGGLEPGNYSVLVVRAGFVDLLLTGQVVNGTSPLEFILSPAPVTATHPLNDTGVTAAQCYRAGTNNLANCLSEEALALNDQQDGMIGRDVMHPDPADGTLGFSFRLVSNPSGGHYDRTECIRDEVTGLMWEGKTGDGGLRDGDRAFTHTGNDQADDVARYVREMNDLSLCGFGDWRLPKASELHGLVRVQPTSPLIDVEWFPNTSDYVYGYWVSDQDNAQPEVGYTINFINGGLGWENRSFKIGRVRLVRGGSQDNNRYVIEADGTEVRDRQTGLIWRRCTEGQSFNGQTCTGEPIPFNEHEPALRHAKTQVGWRVPNVKELASILDLTRVSDGGIDPVAFPGQPPGWIIYWSSTPYPWGQAAYVVNFGGHISAEFRSGDPIRGPVGHRLRLVRR